MQRLSIFAPNHDMSYLVCTEFRRFGGTNGHHTKGRQTTTNNFSERGSTRYSIDSNLETYWGQTLFAVYCHPHSAVNRKQGLTRMALKVL